MLIKNRFRGTRFVKISGLLAPIENLILFRIKFNWSLYLVYFEVLLSENYDIMVAQFEIKTN